MALFQIFTLASALPQTFAFNFGRDSLQVKQALRVCSLLNVFLRLFASAVHTRKIIKSRAGGIPFTLLIQSYWS